MTDRTTDLPSRQSGRPPWRCRWFGHIWRSTVSGNVIGSFVGDGPYYARCDRCGVDR